VNGALGNILTAFPENRQVVDYYDQQPLHGSGYGDKTDRKKISGIIQCNGGRRVRTANGNLVLERRVRFWTDTELVVGRFISDGEYVYRLGIPDDSWGSEVGMYIYDCERVVGGNGLEPVEPAFTHGKGDFA
jgi:hypothetical protein